MNDAYDLLHAFCFDCPHRDMENRAGYSLLICNKTNLEENDCPYLPYWKDVAKYIKNKYKKLLKKIKDEITK